MTGEPRPAAARGRRLDAGRLVLASHNPGKIREFEAFFAPHGVRVVGAGVIGLVEPDETGSTFEENARLKAQTAAEATREVCLADDSGLQALGLDGEPGVHSARLAGPERDFGRAMGRLRAALIERYGAFAAADRRARFVAVLCLAWPDGHVEIAEGAIEGELVDPPRGSAGFGYDPMFQPAGHALTFAEMPAELKGTLSHRGRALHALARRCLA